MFKYALPRQPVSKIKIKASTANYSAKVKKLVEKISGT